MCEGLHMTNVEHVEIHPRVEEIANSITHGIGLVFSLIGFAVLLAVASVRGDTWHIVGCTIYGVSLVILYASSMLYHGARNPRTKEWLRVADYCGIYLLIAGSYTPFTLTVLRGFWGWLLFGLVWTIAATGIFVKLFFGMRFRIFAVVSYLILGWLAVIAIKPMFELMPLNGLIWLFAGGIAYTAGVGFFASKRIYHHTVWHLFVMCGSACHYIAVMLSIFG